MGAGRNDMSKSITAISIVALACAGGAFAQPVIDGSARDVWYGPPLVEQNTQTSLGDSQSGEPDIAEGSELDAMYAAVYDDTLYLVLAGNFNTHFGDRLVLFFDSIPGQGEPYLFGSINPDVDFRALHRMGWAEPNEPDLWGEPGPGLTFPPSFWADYFVSVKCFGFPTRLYVNYAELHDDAQHPGVGYYLGVGEPVCTTIGGWLADAPLDNPFVARCALDNRNTAGVTYGFGSETPAEPVLTGIELALPLEALGSPTGDFEMIAFLTSSRVDFIANQTLNSPAEIPELGDPRWVDLGGVGEVPVTIPIATPQRGACCYTDTCVEETPADCASGGGSYLGDGVSCEGNPCWPLPAGRCCIDNGMAGECHVTNSIDCTNLGGTFEEGEDCTGCPCLIPGPGACCVGDSCYDAYTEDDCAAAAGTFLGRYSECSWEPCAVGACCVETTCAEVAKFECIAAGGEFMGVGVYCEPELCELTILYPKITGDFLYWDPNGIPMDPVEPGVHGITLILEVLSRFEFKVTNGTWNRSVPPANGWLYTDSVGEVAVQYDARTYDDGWLPARDRLIVDDLPRVWTAVGPWCDWDPNDPSCVMTQIDADTHEIEFRNLGPGQYAWKPVVFGTWDGITQHGRAIDGPAFAFEIADAVEHVILRVNQRIGVAQTIVVHDCNGNDIDDAQDIAGCGGQPWCGDCNYNNVLDVCDIASGTSQDYDADGVPDECDSIGACCVGDMCFVVLAQQCTLLDGTYLGDDSDCITRPCGEPCDLMTIDGQVDVRYGDPYAVQDTQTNYGDNNLGVVNLANGSELDAAYAYISGNDRLYLLLSGNLESNYNKLEIFFDTRAGGQNRLLRENPEIDGGALQRMGDIGVGNGLTFDPNFSADFWIGLGGGDEPYTLFVNYAELYVDEGNPGWAQYLGTGFAADRTQGGLVFGANPDIILATINNSNTAGVDGGTDVVDPNHLPEAVATGIELSIPLTWLGNPTGDIKICPFVSAREHQHVANQLLAGIGGGDNLGEPRSVDFGPIAGAQYFTVPRVTYPDCNANGVPDECDIADGTSGDQNGNGIPDECEVVGACCLPSGMCQPGQTEGECAYAGGLWYGADSTCEPSPCRYACCFYGECVENTLKGDCIDGGGTWLFGEWCEEGPSCPPSFGACCTVLFGCFDMTQADCVMFFGGGWYADEACADPNFMCPPPAVGACCAVEETCVGTLSRIDCVNAYPGATWYAGENCEPGTAYDCTPRYAACCVGGACWADLEEVDCLNDGGTWHSGESCSAGYECAPTGACCASGVCVGDETEIGCLWFGGTWYAGELCGDPLFECPWELGDIDDDGDVDVDVDDADLFMMCMNGPQVYTPPAWCDPIHFSACDLDGDGDVDVTDWADFATLFGN